MRSYKLYQYTLPLVEGIFIKDKRLKERKGYILFLQDGQKKGRGEIAPLEGISTESLAEALQETRQWLSKWQQESTPEKNHYASVAFGISCALAELDSSLAMTDNVPQIPNCFGDPDELIEQLSLSKNSIAQINIGLYESVRDGIVVNILLEALPNLTLRLTGTQSWNRQKAEGFIKYINPSVKDRIQYISDPCQTLDLSIAFAEQFDLPLALDIALAQHIDWETPVLKAVIIKPMLLGDLALCQSLIHQAQQKAILPVIENSMESSLGLTQLAAFSQQQQPYIDPNLNSMTLMIQQVIQKIQGYSQPLITMDDLQLIDAS